MHVDLATLRSYLDYNVVELKYTRRRPRAGTPPTRRMLCTNSKGFLMSLLAGSVFHYAPPTKAPKYNAVSNNLIIAYDLFKQDFRANIEPMSAADKIRFMNT